MKGFPKSVIKHDRYGLGRKVSRSAPASNSSSWFSQQESCRCNHHHVLLAQTHISLRLLNFCYLYHIFLLLSHLYTTHTSLTHTLTPSHTSCTHIHIHASYTHTCTHMHYTHIIHTHAHISYTCTHGEGGRGEIDPVSKNEGGEKLGYIFEILVIMLAISGLWCPCGWDAVMYLWKKRVFIEIGKISVY